MEKIRWIILGMALQAFIISFMSIFSIIKLTPGAQIFAGIMFVIIFILITSAINSEKKKTE